MMRYSSVLPAVIMLSVSVLQHARADEKQWVIEEIIVTAEKREAAIQDTPIALSVFNEEMRDNLGISGAADVANYTPSMTYTGTPNRLFIRGVGRVDNSLGSEPGVAIFRDGIYTNEAASVSDNTFFTQRIEVLRGPQSTLYGRNAIGGAASVISKRPTENFNGKIRLGAYSYGGQYAAAAISGPISEKVRYRLVAENSRNDGWIDNQAGRDTQDLDLKRYEVQFEIDVTERLNIWLQYADYETDQHANDSVLLSPYNTSSPGTPIGDFSSDFQQLVPNPQLGYTVQNPGVSNIHDQNVDEPGSTTNRGDRATVHATYDFEQWRLKYIYGYNDYKFESLLDYDRTSRSDIQYLNYRAQVEKYEQNELQLISKLGGRVEFIFGLFSWESDNFQPFTLFSPTNTLLQTPIWADPSGTICFCIVDAPANPRGIFYDQYGDLETQSQAAYSQIDFYPSDAWHVALGLRYSKDEKRGAEYQRLIFDGQGTYAFLFSAIGMSWFNFATPTPGPQSRIAWDFYNGGLTASHKDDWSSTDWSLGADYKIDESTMIYGKVSTGYKSGGYRLGSLQADPAVGEENVLAWEVGVKKQIERSLLNVTAYYYDYEDMQVPVNAIVNGVNNLFFQNAEEANQWGIEMDVQWAVTNALSLFSTLSYMKTEIESMGLEVFDTTERIPTGSDLSGNELVKAPEYKLTINADYRWQLASGELRLVASYVYQDEQWSSIFNRDDTQVPSFERTDFRLTYRNNGDNLRVSAYVRNAFDEEIIENKNRSAYLFNQQQTASIQPPRTIGIEVDFSF